MNYDVPKTMIDRYIKPPAEYRVYDQQSQSCKNNLFGDEGQQPPAPDLGGSPIQPKGDTGTAGIGNPSLTASGINSDNYSSPYIIPKHGSILEVEVNLQIEASNLEEQDEIRVK